VPVAVVEQVGNEVEVMIEGSPPTSGPGGRFRLEHKAGPSALVVLVSPRPITRRGLLLEAGKTLDVGEIRLEAHPSGPGSGPPPSQRHASPAPSGLAGPRGPLAAR
jgi:hypothetical protein